MERDPRRDQRFSQSVHNAVCLARAFDGNKRSAASRKHILIQTITFNIGYSGSA